MERFIQRQDVRIRPLHQHVEHLRHASRWALRLHARTGERHLGLRFRRHQQYTVQHVEHPVPRRKRISREPKFSRRPADLVHLRSATRQRGGSQPPWLRFSAVEPSGTDIGLQYRTADSMQNIASAAWLPTTVPVNTYLNPGNQSLTDVLENTLFLQSESNMPRHADGGDTDIGRRHHRCRFGFL